MNYDFVFSYSDAVFYLCKIPFKFKNLAVKVFDSLIFYLKDFKWYVRIFFEN